MQSCAPSTPANLRRTSSRSSCSHSGESASACLTRNWSRMRTRSPAGRSSSSTSADSRTGMAVIEDVRWLGAELERSYQVYVRGRLKFRVKQIVYVAFSLDEQVMGFAFPRDERAALVAHEPRKFQLPSASDMRFNWVHSYLAQLDPAEARELVVDAWRMVVPQKLSRAYDLTHPNGPG